MTSMRTASIFSLTICALWVLIAIADIWFNIMSGEVFIKMTVTLGLIAVLLLVIALVKREYRGGEQLEKDKHSD